MSNSLISIRTNDNVGQVKLTVYNKLPHTPKAVNYSDSTALLKDDVQSFFAALDTVPLLKMVTKTENEPGSDGVYIYNNVSQDGLQNEFNFWSPTKEDFQKQKLMKAVLELSRQKFTARKHQKYLDSLEHYFDFRTELHATNRPKP